MFQIHVSANSLFKLPTNLWLLVEEKDSRFACRHVLLPHSACLRALESRSASSLSTQAVCKHIPHYSEVPVCFGSSGVLLEKTRLNSMKAQFDAACFRTRRLSLEALTLCPCTIIPNLSNSGKLHVCFLLSCVFLLLTPVISPTPVLALSLCMPEHVERR